ncbi:ABC transporter permease [Tepidibacter aestuarii]|uniref:ABC transporter permease n=1 Tax=Tepidibacter aestuarii TaxID=2925782 RepID=UPI0020BEEBC9|nr:ABC transporter permease [Tepidibacter aestuarii]CAH2213668.1 spermidine preferential ABC transporter membrane subunit PotB [Tepidibacter aestuarii]CAH2215673.1 spermidine preferential ABC transporter membrane subunit PotB [Tepidibacter aestuarii]
MKKKWLSIPYGIWAIIFTIVPLLLIAVYSFCSRSAYGQIVYTFTLDNYIKFMEPIYINVLINSLMLALKSTLICFILGYPMAYILSKSDIKRRNLMMLLFVLPLWTNTLLRTYAWMGILREQGVINQVLMFLNIIDTPLKLLYTDKAVLLGMVYNFLPFMVLPIYSVLSKIDYSLIEASSDLGATSFYTFKKVVFPLSLPGVVSGITMVFMPCVSTFVISDLLGGGQSILLGNLIQNQFLVARNWQFGSAISMIMMFIIIISMKILGNKDREEGGKLW